MVLIAALAGRVDLALAEPAPGGRRAASGRVAAGSECRTSSEADLGPALLAAPIDLSCELASGSFRFDEEGPLATGSEERFDGEQRCSGNGNGTWAAAQQCDEQENFEQLINELVPLLLQLFADPFGPVAAWALLGE